MSAPDQSTVSPPSHTSNTNHSTNPSNSPSDPPPDQSSEQQPTAQPAVSPIYQCHQCESSLSIDAVQLQHIQKQQGPTDSSKSTKPAQSASKTNNSDPPPVSVQCVFVDCPVRSVGLFECEGCSQLSRCRHCAMPLCKTCSLSLKVLQCGFCTVFICSQHCYKEIMNKHFECLEHFGLSIRSHPTMHRLRKLLLPPHLYAAIGSVPDECLPFHICEGCKVQNCGCVNWIACANCRGYYCADCEENRLVKCALEECQARTCCRQKEWDRNCANCLRMGECGNIFCTKGHCNRHIILQNEHGFDFVEESHRKVEGDDEQKDVDKASNAPQTDTDLNKAK